MVKYNFNGPIILISVFSTGQTQVRNAVYVHPFILMEVCQVTYSTVSL